MYQHFRFWITLVVILNKTTTSFKTWILLSCGATLSQRRAYQVENSIWLKSDQSCCVMNKKKNIKKWLMGWRKQSVPLFKGKKHLRQISNVLGVPALRNVGRRLPHKKTHVTCVFLWGNLLPTSSLSEREQHLLSSWSFQGYVYEKEQKHEKMADGVEKKVCLPFQTRQNTIIKTEFKCLALHTQSYKNKTKNNNKHVNRFYIFLAYRGFWFCLMWLVASWVFIWDRLPMFSLSERKQEWLYFTWKKTKFKKTTAWGYARE